VKILTVDPSYKKTGMCLYEYGSKLNEFLSLQCILFINEFDTSYEDKFLYKFSFYLKKIINDDIHLFLEYTPIPRFKSMVAINRVIGVIYASLHPFIISYREIDMNTIYSFFKIHNRKVKKYELHKILLETLPETIFLKTINLTKETITAEKIKKEKLPEDCLDAYAILRYLIECNKS